MNMLIESGRKPIEESQLASKRTKPVQEALAQLEQDIDLCTSQFITAIKGQYFYFPRPDQCFQASLNEELNDPVNNYQLQTLTNYCIVESLRLVIIRGSHT